MTGGPANASPEPLPRESALFGAIRGSVSAEDEGNPKDTAAPDSSPRPEPPRPPLDEPPDPKDHRQEDRLSKQVPIGFLFAAATAAVLVFLAIVAALGYFALSPDR